MNGLNHLSRDAVYSLCYCGMSQLTLSLQDNATACVLFCAAHPDVLVDGALPRPSEFYFSDCAPLAPSPMACQRAFIRCVWNVVNESMDLITGLPDWISTQTMLSKQ